MLVALWLASALVGVLFIAQMAAEDGKPKVRPGSGKLAKMASAKGETIEWRDITPRARGILGSDEQLTLLSELVIGNATGDSAEEMLLLTSINGSHVIGVDGSVTSGTFPDFPTRVAPSLLDFDGDGIGEIYAEEFDSAGMPVGIAVYALDGRRLGGFEGRLAFPPLGSHDFDGDGADDIPVFINHRMAGSKQVKVEFRAVSAGGNVIWSSELFDQTRPAVGDVNGDGVAELILADYRAGKLWIYAKDEDPRTVPGWTDVRFAHSCHDMDGDGCDEVFREKDGYLNLATGVFTPLVFPDTTPVGYMPDDDIFYIDVLPRPGMELVMYGQVPSSLNSWIYVMAADGTWLGSQELSSTVEAFRLLRGKGGVQHIVVMTDEQLLIYP